MLFLSCCAIDGEDASVERIALGAGGTPASWGDVPGESERHGCKNPELDAKARFGSEFAGFFERYVLTERLGSGCFGTVYGVTRREDDSTPLAAKVCDLRVGGVVDERRSLKAQAEAQALGAVAGNANVVLLVEADIVGPYAYIVMERCDTAVHQLIDGLQPLTEVTLAPVLRQMLSGIAAVHKAGIVHRDVKPANFVCAGDVVKLCDFELAAHAPDGVSVERAGLRGLQGTAPFLAPEIVGGKAYGSPIDVWAFGVISYTIFFGRFPYMPQSQRHRSPNGVMRCILEESPPPKFLEASGRSCMSDVATSFVRELLTRQANDRPSAAKALGSPFFSEDRARGDRWPSLGNVFACAKRLGLFDEHKPDDKF